MLKFSVSACRFQLLLTAYILSLPRLLCLLVVVGDAVDHLPTVFPVLKLASPSLRGSAPSQFDFPWCSRCEAAVTPPVTDFGEQLGN